MSVKTAFGRISRGYSRIITKNIPLFLAAGLLSLLPYGASRQASEMIYQLVLPVIMGYMAGRKAGDDSGGMAGTLGALAVVLGKPVSAILGSILAGGLAGYLFARCFRWMKDRIPVGFEMLVRNLLIVLIGGISALMVYLILIPLLGILDMLLGGVVAFLLERGMVPFLSVLIEPMKILFLNNWVNHGFLVPLGMEQVKAGGESLLFLLETNPGPGLGILFACWMKHREERETLSSGMVIEFFGGIHEIYFPYVLADIRLLGAAIGGAFVGNFFFMVFGDGLRAPASPGSMVTILMLSPMSHWLTLILGIGASAATAAVLAWFLMAKKDRQREERMEESALTEMRIKTICFVCDAGIGSSAMGAALLRRKMKAMGIMDVSVGHAAVDEIPEQTDVIICQRNFVNRFSCPGAELYTVENLTNMQEYEAILARLKGGNER